MLSNFVCPIFIELQGLPETAEQRAPREIDPKLTASGWFERDRDDLEFTPERGIALREFPAEHDSSRSLRRRPKSASPQNSDRARKTPIPW